MIENIKKIIQLIKPKAYNRITVIGLTGGIALIGSPCWVPILEAILETKLELPLPDFDEKVIGLIIVLASLTYNIVYRWNEMRSGNDQIIPKYWFRYRARKAIKKYLNENKNVFNSYGPYSDSAKNKPYETEKQWIRLSNKKIIPNNERIIEIVNKNSHLLREDEMQLFEDFKIHASGFAYNKSSEDLSSAVKFYPKEFSNIFK